MFKYKVGDEVIAIEDLFSYPKFSLQIFIPAGTVMKVVKIITSHPYKVKWLMCQSHLSSYNLPIENNEVIPATEIAKELYG